jgi:hypothetical protein
VRHVALEGGGAAHLQRLVRDIVVVLPHVRQDDEVALRHCLGAQRVKRVLVARLCSKEQHPLQTAAVH